MKILLINLPLLFSSINTTLGQKKREQHSELMDPKNPPLLIILLATAVFLIITFTHFPSSTSSNPKLLSCTTSSPYCLNSPKHSDTVPHHPLDPLTLTEINLVKSILNSHPLFTSSTTKTIHSLVLHAPRPKMVQIRPFTPQSSFSHR